MHYLLTLKRNFSSGGTSTTIDAHYDSLAREEILSLLDREHAAVWLEIEAKIAEPLSTLRGLRKEKETGINPHHLTNARHQLLQQGAIQQIGKPTRGAHDVDVLALAERYKRQTAFERAAARKRLLQARYLGWASNNPSMIGTALERVTRASLIAATKVNYQPIVARAGEVVRLFGNDVPGGPLDSGAYFTVLDENSVPQALTLLIEIKNVREWIYPTTAELHQLLDKAARLQLARPSAMLVPVLVCRKAQFTTFKMAKDLGFLVSNTSSQPIIPHSSISIDHLNEVRDELGYDLVSTDSAMPWLVGFFNDYVPGLAFPTASRWSQTAPILGDIFRRLRNGNLTPQSRHISPVTNCSH